jgi:hypothetical protein
MNQKVIYSLLNALIVGGIVFLSSLPSQYPPTAQVLYQAVIGAGLALLTQVKSIMEGLIGDGNGGGKSGIDDLTIPEQEIHINSIRKDNVRRLGMLI